jgi:hypothetical protein
MAGLGIAIMADIPIKPPAYDESLVRRFEPGSAESLSIAALRGAGFELYFERGLRKVRVVDAHGKSKTFSWKSFGEFVDDLRTRAGKEPIFRSVERRSEDAKRVADVVSPNPLTSEETPDD